MKTATTLAVIAQSNNRSWTSASARNPVVLASRKLAGEGAAGAGEGAAGAEEAAREGAAGAW